MPEDEGNYLALKQNFLLVAKSSSAKMMEKRAFKRMMVNIRGDIELAGRSRAVLVRDYCMGGMFLSFAGIQGDNRGDTGFNPALGDEIKIRCKLIDEKISKELAFTATVVREDKFGIGVSFIGLDFEMLNDLSNYARRHPYHESAEASAQSSSHLSLGGISLQPVQILARCKEVAATFIEPISKAFFKEAPDTLFATAGASRDLAEQNAYFAALNLLNDNCVEFIKVFTVALNSYWNKGLHYIEEFYERPSQTPSLQTLSLVEEDTLEEWLSFQDMANKSESLHEEDLIKLNKRLALIYGETVDKMNNPFAPAAVCHAFQAAIGKLHLERKALQICAASFKNVLADQSGNLIHALNQVLIEHNVLPNIVAEYKVHPLGAVAVQSQAAEVGVKAEQQKDIQADHAPAHDSSVSESNYRAAAKDIGTALKPRPMPVRNWYSLVEHLSNLNSQIENITQSSSSASAQGGVPVSGDDGQQLSQAMPSDKQVRVMSAATQFCSQEELMTALTRVPALTDPVEVTGSRLIDYIVRQLHGQGFGQGTKEIPHQEREVLNVAGNLYDAIINDRMVADSVKPWLQKLSIPMIKIALLDEGFFTDKNHKARQLVNKIAQLEFYGNENGEPGVGHVQARIYELLDQIGAEVTITSESLDKPLTEVDTLVRIQNKAYADNIKDLIKASQVAQPEEAMMKPVAVQALALEAEKDAEFAEWVKRIKRLRAGAYVVIGLNTDSPKRIRLAWVAKDFHRYVFSNNMGLKDAEYGQYELAKMFYEGRAIAPDDMNELVLDRAQYNMLEELNRKLIFESSHDKLTGLMNRREFEAQVSSAMEKLKPDENGICLTVSFLGIEQLGPINSSFGYKAGDKLLLEVVKILESLNAGDIILAHISSNEFGIMCRRDLLETMGLFDRLRKKFQNFRFEWEGNSLKVTFNASIAAAAVGVSADKLLQSASSSFRLAKAKGPNQIQVYQEDDIELQRQKRCMEWAAKIDETLESNRLAIRYQRIVPVVPHPDAREHMEILLCLREEDGSLVSPADFVVAAEFYRRMADIDRWVIKNVFAWMGANPNLMKSIESISINLSGDSINDDHFLEFVLQLTRNNGLPMDCVCFEITETAGISNLSSTADFIREIKQTGCRFSLDDFGSGHSSYAYLKNLPVDYLKIDGVFVKEMHRNPSDYAVVKSITEIGHFMEKKIVAEYVENDDVLNMLADIGVDYAQGYVHGPPRLLKDYKIHKLS